MDIHITCVGIASVVYTNVIPKVAKTSTASSFCLAFGVDKLLCRLPSPVCKIYYHGVYRCARLGGHIQDLRLQFFVYRVWKQADVTPVFISGFCSRGGKHLVPISKGGGCNLISKVEKDNSKGGTNQSQEGAKAPPPEINPVTPFTRPSLSF